MKRLMPKDYNLLELLKEFLIARVFSLYTKGINIFQLYIFVKNNRYKEGNLFYI